MTIVIRNSDISAFKECREMWNYSSSHRNNLRPNQSPKYFGFGTAIHSGEQTYYNPTEPFNRADALDAFLGSWTAFIKDCFNPQEWGEMRDLGLGMLSGYFEWASKEDDFVPKRVEVEFEVPIMVPPGEGRNLPVGFGKTAEGQLTYKGERVAYGGRVDLLGQFEDGTYVIVDHKTASRWYELAHLDMDEQLGRYAYAMWVLGFTVSAIYYNQLLKAIPGPPKLLERRLKSGKVKRSLSVAKDQPGVSAESFTQAVADNGLHMSDYTDHIQWLQENPPKFYRRLKVYKTKAQYAVLHKQLFYEAVDMLNNPSIYPTPKWNGCDKCLYLDPCLAKMEGKSDQLIIKMGYHTREEDE